MTDETRQSPTKTDARATWASWHPDEGFHGIFIDAIEGATGIHTAEYLARQDAATQDYMSSVDGWKAVPVSVEQLNTLQQPEGGK